LALGVVDAGASVVGTALARPARISAVSTLSATTLWSDGMTKRIAKRSLAASSTGAGSGTFGAATAASRSA